MVNGVKRDDSCTFNAAPIIIEPNATIELGALPYESREQLHELRSQHRKTHLFRRHGNFIENLSLVSDCSALGETTETKLADVPLFATSLALDSLLRLFHSRKRIIRDYRPLLTVSPKREHDLLLCAAGQTEIPRWLRKPRLYAFNTRIVRDDHGATVQLLTCDVRATNIIDASCSELIDAGVALQGRYVARRVPRDDDRLYPRLELLGRVADVRDSTLVLDDHREGHQEIAASEVLLEPRAENLYHCIRSVLPRQASQILRDLDVENSRNAGGRQRLDRVRSILDYIGQAGLELAPDVPFSLGALLSTRNRSEWFPYREVIRKPALTFAPGERRTDAWNERGLDRHGPYDQQFFTPKRPNIAIICESAAQGRVEQFAAKFFDGLPAIRYGNRAPYEKGFLRRFALERLGNTRVFVTEGGSADSYHQACREALEYAADHGFAWDLAIIQIRSRFRELTGSDNPYLVSKYALLKQQVPSQSIFFENIDVPDKRLVFTMNNLSVASYAKLGGVPWLLPADSTVAHEIVAGVASHEVSSSRIGRNERYVGITTLFTGDGQYLLESRTAAVPFEEYMDAMIDSMKRAIELIRKEQNWQPNDPVRIVVHGFKPLKNLEVRAFRAVMRDLKLPSLEYAFVHVVDDHAFALFNETEAGAKSYGGATKGVLAPHRGLYVRLGDYEALVALKGANELKQPSDGLPTPLLLRIHRDSTFRDITYLARQVFNFSCHSWRTLSPAPLPITILYSQMIARLIRSFQDLPSWDEDVLLGPVGRTRWFL